MHNFDDHDHLINNHTIMLPYALVKLGTGTNLRMLSFDQFRKGFKAHGQAQAWDLLCSGKYSHTDTHTLTQVSAAARARY